MIVLEYLDESPTFEVVDSLEDGEALLAKSFVPARLLEVTLPAGYADDLIYHCLDHPEGAPEGTEMQVLATNYIEGESAA